ncbi:SGNH/GDSL hydrolase family protein [Aquisphaera insulae]|uniref:SGNH/GDSL hydrolase family protein n=1 Tax=Aquisphaera insulae TaxID=2712864 RepID=UPI0013ED7A0C|nr:SGNH/GDSL hydrolase family protein [Aquisphaera insulae]
MLLSTTAHAWARHAESARPLVQSSLRGLGNVGALGDSYTDEYASYKGQARGFARNWVEILQATRGVSFGKYSARARPEPRDAGYADNWARSDATSADMIGNQLGGLVDQVRKGQVRTASVFIGGNDFLDTFRAIAAGQISPTNAVGAIQQAEARLETNFTTAVDSLLAASPNVRVVVWTLPDVSTLPAIRQAVAAMPWLAPLRDAGSRAVGTFNAKVTAIAASSPRIALVDLASITKQLAIAPSSVPFGGTTIDLTTPGNDYHHFFLSDQIHVGTVGQGLIANAFVNAVDARFGLHVKPLTPTQIVAFAKRVRPS